MRFPKQENKQSLCIQILIDSFLLYTRLDYDPKMKKKVHLRLSKTFELEQ